MSIQKYRMKIEFITKLENILEVRFEYLAGIYELHEKDENYTALCALLMAAKNNKNEIEFSILGNKIVDANI